MRALVGVKRVIDYAVKVRVLANKSGVNLSNVRLYTERGILRDVDWYSNMNPSDVHIKDNVSI